MPCNTVRRLRWLGLPVRMEDDRIPKKRLSGWSPQRCLAHGTKLRWRVKVREDLKRFGVNEGSWFHAAHERAMWRAQCREVLNVRMY